MLYVLCVWVEYMYISSSSSREYTDRQDKYEEIEALVKGVDRLD